MDFGTAIQTRRDALLRLLAGWLALAVLPSAAPVSPAWTRQARLYLSSVVRRADLAARYLTIAQARLSAHRLGVAGPARGPRLLAESLSAPGPGTGEPPSLAELRARLLALRRLLKNLPCRGMRLLRRTLTGRGGMSSALPGARLPGAMRPPAAVPAADQCAPVPPWHPPKSTCAVLPVS